MERALFRALLLTLFLASLPVQAFAQASPPTALVDYILKDQFSAQVVSGVLFSPVIKREGRADLDYAQTNLRLIWGLDPELTVRKLGWKGSFDLIFELTHSFVMDGAGNFISGVTGLLRYNFPSLTDTERLFPYIQTGVGFVYNDVHKDLSQNVIGQAVEFNPQFSLGLHYLLDKKWALDGETMFHHISNAGMSHGRNQGVNAIGGFIGLTRYFKGL
jgi:hypothetical protein